MRSGLKLWPGFPFRQISSAWGVALEAHGVTLVCLGRSDAQEVRVLRALQLLPPAWAQESDSHHDWLVQTLREVSGQEVRRHRRLVVALPMGRCQTGQLDCPASLDAIGLQAEVQLDAAQSLNVAVHEVSFDFEAQATELPRMQRVRWLACLQSEVQAWHRHTRAAGWRLPAIEHHEQAARRAVQALGDGAFSLQTRAHQDWRFDWPAGHMPSSTRNEALDEAQDAELQSMRGASAWAWLCACGAGLRALS